MVSGVEYNKEATTRGYRMCYSIFDERDCKYVQSGITKFDCKVSGRGSSSS